MNEQEDIKKVCDTFVETVRTLSETIKVLAWVMVAIFLIMTIGVSATIILV